MIYAVLLAIAGCLTLGTVGVWFMKGMMFSRSMGLVCSAFHLVAVILAAFTITFFGSTAVFITVMATLFAVWTFIVALAAGEN